MSTNFSNYYKIYSLKLSLREYHSHPWSAELVTYIITNRLLVFVTQYGKMSTSDQKMKNELVTWLEFPIQMM